jgi:hypothetical protein
MVELKLEDIHVVQEYPDIFHDDLPRMQPGTTPIVKAPYKMSPMEVKELKIQL